MSMHLMVSSNSWWIRGGFGFVPAQRLDQNPKRLPHMGVVGQDAQIAGFIGHAGLTNQEHPEVKVKQPVSVCHMQPPLAANSEMLAHVHGDAELTDDEANQIALFADEHAEEHEAQNRRIDRVYVVRPHTVDTREDDETTVSRKFSCAGFVIEAYRNAGIDLVDTDEDALPQVAKESVSIAYPQIFARSNASAILTGIGLNGSGPWPVVLPGYLFHSLARDAGEIREGPYRAKLGMRCLIKDRTGLMTSS